MIPMDFQFFEIQFFEETMRFLMKNNQKTMGTIKNHGWGRTSVPCVMLRCSCSPICLCSPSPLPRRGLPLRRPSVGAVLRRPGPSRRR